MEEIRSFLWIRKPLRTSNESANKGCNISHTEVFVSASLLCLSYMALDTHMDCTGHTSNQAWPWPIVSQHFDRHCKHCRTIILSFHIKIYGAVLNLIAKDLLTMQTTLGMWQEAGVFQSYGFASLSCCGQCIPLSLFWKRKKTTATLCSRSCCIQT